MKRLLPLMLCFPMLSMAADCGDLPNQSDMNQCAGKAYKAADTELNRVYNNYRARLEETDKRKLKDVQLAWIKFRDLSCEFESSSVEGGSVHPYISLSCLAKVTRTRIQQLEVLANCKEGDLSCPTLK